MIANLPVRLRSTLSSIYLAALFKTVHIKKYGYSKVLEPLIRDLQHLETTGVFVKKTWVLYIKVLFCMCQQTTWSNTPLQDTKSLSMFRNFADFVQLALNIFSSRTSEVGHLLCEHRTIR